MSFCYLLIFLILKLSYLRGGYMFPCYSLLGMKVIWVYYLLLIDPCTFTSGFLNFPINLQDIKTLYRKFFSQQFNVSVFKENMNLQLPYSFYSSIVFVNETVFVLEQNIESWCGALFEISDKFSSKLSVFRYMILQCWFKTLENS